MTVRDLMEILEMFDEDAEVKLAYQPSWPLCTAVASVKKKDGVVYVCESGYGGNDYAPHCLFESDEYVDLGERRLRVRRNRYDAVSLTEGLHCVGGQSQYPCDLRTAFS